MMEPKLALNGAMSDVEKKQFELMAENDKKRYERDMQQYAAMGGTPLKRKQTKDPNAPKRALSGFFFFCGEERPSVRAANPDWNVAEVAKELGRRWAVCPNKQKYELQSKKDKERYEQQMAEYKRKKPRTMAPVPTNQMAEYKRKKPRTMAPVPMNVNMNPIAMNMNMNQMAMNMPRPMPMAAHSSAYAVDEDDDDEDDDEEEDDE